MKTEQQRIAIAEACNFPPWRFGASWIATAGLEIHGIDGTRDYLKDLNAMHEAEKVLNASTQWSRYECELDNIVFRDATIKMWKATAAQRAEAFLRTIGKWEDSY